MRGNDFTDSRADFERIAKPKKKEMPVERKFIRCKQAAERYCVSRPTIMRWAEEAGALHKVNEGTVLINFEILDKYLETFRIPGEIR